MPYFRHPGTVKMVLLESAARRGGPGKQSLVQQCHHCWGPDLSASGVGVHPLFQVGLSLPVHPRNFPPAHPSGPGQPCKGASLFSFFAVYGGTACPDCVCERLCECVGPFGTSKLSLA